MNGPHGRQLVDVDTEIPGRGVTVIVGPSGAGKSTLLRLCNRLEVASDGAVWFRGERIAELDPLKLRRRVGMVFQQPTTFAGTVFDNLLVAEPALSRDAAAALLSRVELSPELLDRPAHELSGGEAQRVCLARTLVAEPDVVVMDEPTSSVDPAGRQSLEQLARDLAASGVPIVWVTHDLAQMRRLADHVIVVLDGCAVANGGPATIDQHSSAPVRAFFAADPHDER